MITAITVGVFFDSTVESVGEDIGIFEEQTEEITDEIEQGPEDDPDVDEEEFDQISEFLDELD